MMMPRVYLHRSAVVGVCDGVGPFSSKEKHDHCHVYLPHLMNDYLPSYMQPLMCVGIETT